MTSSLAPAVIASALVLPLPVIIPPAPATSAPTPAKTAAGANPPLSPAAPSFVLSGPAQHTKSKTLKVGSSVTAPVPQ
jgi:hypothetical protein